VVGLVSALILAAGGITFALTSKSSHSSTTTTTTVQIHSTLTAGHRAIDRCTVVVAAGVGNIQENGISASNAIEAKLGRDSWIYLTILKANDYLNVALQRVHPKDAALQQAAQEIIYLCAHRVQSIAVEAKQGSTVSTTVERAYLKDFITSIAVAATVTGVSIGTLHYFARTRQYTTLSGVTGVDSASGFTGLTGSNLSGVGPTGTSGGVGPTGDTAPGGFTGVTGSSGVSGGQSGPTGFTGSGGGGPAGPS
jgi:hypothetical protein